MSGEGPEQVSGIMLGLGLDTTGFSAGISKARGELSALEATPVRIRAQVALPTRGLNVAITPNLSVGRQEISAFRTQIAEQLRGLGANSAVAVPIRLGRVNYSQLRAQIAAGIGEVPIKVVVSGKGSPASIVAATVAESSGASTAQATSFVTNAGRKRGITPRRYGGPVEPNRDYLVGEDGPEVLRMRARGGHIYPMAARGVRARAYEDTIRQGGGTFGPAGAPSRGYAVGLAVGTYRQVPVGDARGFMRSYRDVQSMGAPYTGTWVNEGNIHLDPVDVLRRKREANRLASRKAQIAYYDLLRGDEITTRRLRGDPSPGQMGFGFARGGSIAARLTPEQADFEGNLRTAHQRLKPHNIEGGRRWYPDSGTYGRERSDVHGVDHVRGVGILAALSAGTQWKSNQTKFEKILAADAAGKPFPYDVGGERRVSPAGFFEGERVKVSAGLDAHRKAAAILRGASPADVFASSPKVGQFYPGMMGDLSTLTIDRWALRTATRGALSQIGKGPVRTQIEAAWRKVAAEFGMEPAVSQAALWLQEKEESQVSPGQSSLGFARGGRMRAGGGFSYASEVSALARLRAITHKTGRILPGYEPEARDLNLQIERMRSTPAVESPWVRRMREQGTVAKEFRAGGGLARSGLPSWAREEMLRRGLDPNRPLNDIDINDPAVRDAVSNDPTLSSAERTRTLRTGSPRASFRAGGGMSLPWCSVCQARYRGSYAVHQTTQQHQRALYRGKTGKYHPGSPGWTRVLASPSSFDENVDPYWGTAEGFSLLQSLEPYGGEFGKPRAGGGPVSREFVVADRRGIHSRPSGALARAAQGFSSRIQMSNLTSGQTTWGGGPYSQLPFEAGSMMHWLMLGAKQGDRVGLTGTGEDAEAALGALGSLIGNPKLTELENEHIKRAYAQRIGSLYGGKRAAGGKISRTLRVSDPDGIHGRPSMFMAGLAQDFGVNVSAENKTLGGDYVTSRGTSLEGWLRLNARGGHRIRLNIEGERAKEAMEAYRTMFAFNPYAEGLIVGNREAERKSGFADFNGSIGSAYKQLYHRLRPRAGGGEVGPYIVGERGPELFVPKRLEGLIPPDVMARLPKAAGGGGVQEIGKKPFSVFEPPEDGWVIPNHLRGRIARMAAGGRARRQSIRGDAGSGYDPSMFNRTTDSTRFVMPEEADADAAARERAAERFARRLSRAAPEGPLGQIGLGFAPTDRSTQTEARVRGNGTRRRAKTSPDQIGLGLEGGNGPVSVVIAGATAQGGTEVARAIAKEGTAYHPTTIGGLASRNTAYEMGAKEAAAKMGRPYAQVLVPGGTGHLAQLRSETYGGSNELRDIMSGASSLLSGRSSIRSAAANVGSFFVGGRQSTELQRRRATRAIGDVTDIERQRDRHEARRAKAEDTYEQLKTHRDLLAATGDAKHVSTISRLNTAMDKQVVAMDRERGAVDELSLSHRAAYKDAEKAARAAAPGGKNVAQNIFGIGLGVAGYQLGSQALGFASEAVEKAVASLVDQLTGFQSTTTRVASSLATDTEALKGNSVAAIANAAATANLTGASNDYLTSSLKPTVGVLAGAQAQGKASELFRAAYGVQQGKAPTGLYGGYGGFLGSSLFAQQMGGGKGFTETAYGDLAGFQSGAPGGDVVGDLGRGLNFVTDTGTRDAILKAGKEQGGSPLTFAADALGGVGDLIGGAMSLFAPQKPLVGEGPAVAGFKEQLESKYNPQGLQAAGAYMDQLTADAKKGTAAIGSSLKEVTFGFATSQKELDTAAQAAAQAGDLPGFGNIEKTGIIARVGGVVVSGGDQYRQAMQATATGAGIGDVASMAPAMALQLRAREAATAASVQLQNRVQIPAALGFGLMANPLISPMASIGRGGVAGAGLSSSAAAGVTATLKQSVALQAQLNSEADKGLQIARETVVANGGDVQAYDAGIASVRKYSAAIAGIQTQIDFTQSTLSAKQFNVQMFYLQRNLSDALGLAGQLTGSDNLGALQRQSFMIGRQQTALGLGLQQRSITTAVAVAGFQAPGESPEERYARREEALVKARVQQRQLNLSKQQYGVEGQIFNVQAGRGVGDAQRAVALAQAERDAAVQITALSKALAANQQLEQQASAKTQSIYEGALTNFNTKLSAAAELMGQVPGTTLTAALTAIDTAMNGPKGVSTILNTFIKNALGGLGTGPGASPTGGGTNDSGARYGLNKPSGGGTGTGGSAGTGGGAGGNFASGIVGMTSGPSHAYIGEAGREAVAIIRNPRAMQMSSGGSSCTVNVIVSGNTFAGPPDESRLVARLAAEVERRMNTKGRLLGLRGPAY